VSDSITKKRETEGRFAQSLLVRTSAAPAFVGLPASTFFKLAKRPDFPRKVILGPQATGYMRGELVAFFEALKVEQLDRAEQSYLADPEDC
jgi:predicted DNA-binding transcriptional regulator AlpA